MLIKSELLSSAEGEKETSLNEGEDKLQKRIKQDQGAEISSKLYSTKYFNFVNERKQKKSSSPLDVTEVRPYLFLCGAVALRGNTLEDLKATCVINATKELPDTPLPSSLKDNVLYLRVNVEDKADSDILSWLDFVADIINQKTSSVTGHLTQDSLDFSAFHTLIATFMAAEFEIKPNLNFPFLQSSPKPYLTSVKLAGGKSLIHCVAGVSRSATLCLAYLIKYEGHSLLDSYIMLKTLRDIIRPNSGFFGQLVEFEKRVTGTQTVRMIYSDYARSRIPQLYEEDYQRLHILRCRRT